MTNEDAISRQEVLNMMQMRIGGKELYKAVYNLPSVVPQQESCEDAISRAYIEPIVEELENICINGDEHILSLLSNIKNAPSANPQESCSNCCNGNQIEKAKLCQKSYLAGMKHKQEPKWIPVSEKMPGHYEVVLACCNDDFVTLASFSYKEDRWECLTNMSSDTHFPENEEVIAWMPLPEPYVPDTNIGKMAESASEKEKLKAEVNGYFYGLNAAGKIDWQTYSILYNVCMSILEKYYDRMEKERRAESEDRNEDAGRF